MSASKASEKVIVVRLPNWVGDVCMVMPSLALLAQTGCKLMVCGKPFAQPLLHSLPDFRFIAITGSILKDARLLRHELGRIHADINGLLFPDSLSSALAFKLAGIDSAGYRDDGRSLLLRWPVSKPAIPGHAVLKWYGLTCQAIRHWQLPVQQPIPDVPAPYAYEPGTQDIERVDEVLRKHNLHADEPYVLIAPTATGLHKGQIKVWSGFSDLTRSLLDQGYRVLICPPAHERHQAQQAAPDAEMLDPLSLGAFAQLARKARLVVCNDSGVSHIAALVGARQITLFGVTDPVHTRPWSSHAICLGKLGAWPDTQTVLEHCLNAMQKPKTEDSPVRMAVSGT